MQSPVAFTGRHAVDPWYDARVADWCAVESRVAEREFVEGWCDCCGGRVPLKVDGGLRFGERIALRAGMLCPNGLFGATRLLLRVARREKSEGVCAVFEQGTRFTEALARTTRLTLLESEYFGPGAAPGSTHPRPGGLVQHQDMTASTHADASIDLIVHSEVLEHVPDDGAALRDHFRILRPGGAVVFTVPFFVQLDRTYPLAWLDGEGRTVFDGEPVYHGDRITGAILTYHMHGWDLLTRLREAGFADAAVEVCFDCDSGILSDNHPVIRGGNNPPLVIVARKAAA